MFLRLFVSGCAVSCLIPVCGLGNASLARNHAHDQHEDIRNGLFRCFRESMLLYGDAGTLEPEFEGDAGACDEGPSTAVCWCGSFAWLEFPGSAGFGAADCSAMVFLRWVCGERYDSLWVTFF